MPTEAQWIKHLDGKIADQAAYAKRWEPRYRNEYVLPFIRAEFAEVYGSSRGDIEKALAAMEAIQPPRAGTAAVVVDALTERLTVEGATSDTPEAVAVVEDAWVANDLDVMHREAHREAMIKGRAFALVESGVDGKAVVSIEAAEQMAVHRQAAPPYDIDAAMKTVVDEWTQRETRILYLPGKRLTYTKDGADWTLGPVADIPGGVVPVIEFAHRQRLLVEPQSEIEGIESLADIVDLIEGLMVFAGHFGAVPIRYGTGVQVLKDPANPAQPLLVNGKPQVGFDHRADRMWVSTDKDTKFGQLTPAALDTFVQWAQHASMRIRAKTGLASTYLSLDLKSHMSAELLKTDEAPMVRRIKGLQAGFGQAWRRVMQLALAMDAPALAGTPVRPRWADPQTRIESQDSDIFAKLAPSLGAVTVAEKVMGWSPLEARRGADEARQAARDGDAELDAMLDRLNGDAE